MKEQLKKKWIKALESGNYEQGGSDLIQYSTERKTEQYCCLGVLCDVQGFRGDSKDRFFEAIVDLKDLPNGPFSLVDQDPYVDAMAVKDGKIVLTIRGALPTFVQNSLGLNKKVKSRGRSISLHDKLVEMNDEGEPFEKIAAYLKRVKF